MTWRGLRAGETCWLKWTSVNADDPWLILHKLDSPTKMRYIGARFAACKNLTSPTVVPGSIREWVAQTGMQHHLALAIPHLLAAQHDLPVCSRARPRPRIDIHQKEWGPS